MRADKEPATGWGERMRCLIAAACCWLAASSFWLAWHDPMAYQDGAWVKLGVALLVTEFIAIHSGTLIGELASAGAGMRRYLWPVLAAYGLFALALPLAFGSLTLGLVMAALMLSRLHDALRPASGRERAYGRRRSLVSAILFVLLGFASVVLPIPPGGITPDLLDQLWPDRGGGIWEAEPQRALAMGLIYFGWLGVVELRPPEPAWEHA